MNGEEEEREEEKKKRGSSKGEGKEEENLKVMCREEQNVRVGIWSGYGRPAGEWNT